MGGGSTSLKVARVSYMDAHLSACGWRNKHNEACWCCCPASLACSMPLLLPTSLAKRQIYDRVFANVPVGATLFGHVWNFELHDRKKSGRFHFDTSSSLHVCQIAVEFRGVRVRRWRWLQHRIGSLHRRTSDKHEILAPLQAETKTQI